MRLRGDIGEDAAAEFLSRHDAKILCRNYKARNGEIDIIAESAHYLLFVEVKSRRVNPAFAMRPAAAVTLVKQRHILSAAEQWLARSPEIPDKPIRFDVVEVFLSQHEPVSVLDIRYLPGAFTKS